LETRKIKDLIPYDRNPRNNKDAVDKVLESLNRHGQVKPIVVSAKGKPFEQETIVAGHTTMQALKRFGAKEAFVVVKEFADEAQFVDYNIRDNKAGEFAQWDDQELANLSAEFEIDLDEMGFEDFDIEEESEGNTDEDAVPEVPEEPTAKLGQMWKLGDHRLMCGDSTDREQVERLMGGEKADMVFTDPPYGDNHAAMEMRPKGGKGCLAAKILNIENDSDISYLSEVFGLISDVSIYDSPKFVFFKWNKWEKIKEMASSFGEPKTVCVWDRDSQGASTFRINPVHEFCFYWGTLGDKKEKGNLRNVWRCRKERDSKEMHPTVKPIEIIEPCLRMCCSLGGLVLDLFGGSGSTLIACEKTKRKCRMMELDPKYIDVIIERWQNFTGKKAELIES